MSDLCARRSRDLRGELSVPGDKSISHRAVILGALAEGETHISGFLPAQDTLNTARALQAMGVGIEGLGAPDVLVRGVGLRGFRAPDGPLDLGNSGTGMRILMGAMAGQTFATTLIGDASLSSRPMDRIARPLEMMGIRVEGQGDRCTPPVTVHGARPTPIAYHSPVASAQVKSAVLLAGLHAQGKTTVTEPAKSRDHTERMMQAFGAEVMVEGLTITVQGNPTLRGLPVSIPGDFSSAAYFIAAGILCGDSRITLADVLLNPTRSALLDVLESMGAPITRGPERLCAGERVGDITAATAALSATQVRGAQMPSLIDEIPILAVIATQARGVTEIRDAAELRVKESDRLALVARGLRSMGADVRELPDGLIITGPANLTGAAVDAHLDHRIAMSFAVAGLVADGHTTISGAECIRTSFPGFAPAMQALGAHVTLLP